MKTRCLILIVTIFLTNSYNSFAQQKVETVANLKIKFEEKMGAWKNAYNSGDAKNLVPLYSEDAIYTSSHLEGLEAIGRDKLISNFQNGMNMGGQIDKIEILKMDVTNEMVYLFCKYQATNAGETVSGRNLLVLKKLKNDWKIVIHMTVV